MITANQLRAARALLNIDQRQTADLANLSVPTIQRMESSEHVTKPRMKNMKQSKPSSPRTLERTR